MQEPSRDPLHANSYYFATAKHFKCYPLLDESVDCDICVIGGGFTGLSAALNLSELGYDVVVLESGRAGCGASGRNGGQVGTGLNQSQSEVERKYGWEHAKLLWDLCEEAKQEVRRRIDLHKIHCDYKSGVIGAAVTAQSARDYEADIENLQNRYHCDSIEYVSAQQMRQMFGERGYFGGRLDADAGHIHPLNYAIGLAGAFAASGGRIYEQTRAVSFDSQSDAVDVRTSAGLRVRASILVIACNAYLEALERTIARLILPIYSYMIATEPLDEAVAVAINRDDVAVYDSRADLDYYRLSADRRMLFGAGESFFTELHAAKINAKLRARMVSLYPELRDARIDYSWGGRIALTFSRLPALGCTEQNVYYAQGFSGHGVALTGIAGKIIAEAISGKRERFEAFVDLQHRKFAASKMINWLAYEPASKYYRIRDSIAMRTRGNVR